MAAAAADQRDGFLRAAVVAAQLPRAPVQGHSRVAVGARCHPAAGIAKQRGCIAAAVQEHDDLSAGAEMFGDRLHGGLRYALIGRMAPEVDERHLWRPCAAGTFRQRYALVAALGDVFERFQRGGRRAENDRHGGALGAQHREIARRIAKPLLLLVRGIVFLIDDDEREIRQRGEYGRASADHDAGLAVVGHPPGVASLGSRESRVQYCESAVKAPLKSIDELRSQRDFRHQHERLAAAGDCSLDRAQIDLGLAAARDSVEQNRGEARQRSDDRCKRSRLRGGQRIVGAAGAAGAAGVGAAGKLDAGVAAPVAACCRHFRGRDPAARRCRMH